MQKTYISSFIGLIIIIWLAALWFQGTPVFSIDFVRPFGIVVSIVSLVVTIFYKYAWAWRLFQGWFVKRPDIRGTWKVELSSSWVNPNTKKESKITGYAVVRQTLSSLSLRLLTKESYSKLVIHNIEEEEDNVFRLFATYRNEPKIELQGKRSDIHYGSMLLNIYGKPANKLEGHYWTDRMTRGSIKFYERRKKIVETFDQAQNEFKNK